ncbi:MAG: HD domain-containing protein [Conexivisphaerales archaeon]|nr:HD domain-containing protein [Conexivisphaerales archaeon]
MGRRVMDVISYLPEIGLIGDGALRKGVIEVWSRLWDMSKFASPEDVPVLPGAEYPHMVHNRSVLNLVISAADILEKYHGERVKVNRDLLIAAAALQDSSKLVEYEPSEGGVRKSRLGEMFQHGFYAAHTALEVGLPMEVAELIVEHTFDNPTYPRTLEGKLVFYADQMDMAAIGLDRWRKVQAVFRRSKSAPAPASAASLSLTVKPLLPTTELYIHSE